MAEKRTVCACGSIFFGFVGILVSLFIIRYQQVYSIDKNIKCPVLASDSFAAREDW
jgi:hypothetical protein